MFILYRCCLVLAALPLSSPALAQQSPRPAPTDASAAAPALEYRSALSSYQSYRDADLADWRAVNDEVARAGGHIGIVGGAGPAGHGAGKPSAMQPGAGQPPIRSAPQAPAHQ